MVFRHFRIQIISRVLILCVTILAIAWLLSATEKYVTTGMVILLFILQVIFLIRFVEKTNRTMAQFLQAIEYDDFTQSFGNVSGGKSFDELNQAFVKVSANFREVRMGREENFRYLQTVVQHVGVGMVAFQESGEVELFNSTAKKTLQLASLKNINDLEAISPELLERIGSLKPGERDLVRVTIDNNLVQLSLLMTILMMRNRKITLVSFQNISTELNEKEMQAWQNLIRVFTHEIKNSLTPISSLAGTIETLLLPVSSRLKEQDIERMADISEALMTIKSRSEGLHEFINAYRDLTNLPQPVFESFKVTSMFERVGQLVKDQIQSGGVNYCVDISNQTLSVTADSQMIEQVLINLILNSIQALDGCEKPKLTVCGFVDDQNRVTITVEDNGPGIANTAIDKIFVPFFTTKKNGSGIGLSLSRQIMRLHKGELTVSSEPDKSTILTMRF